MLGSHFGSRPMAPDYIVVIVLGRVPRCDRRRVETLPRGHPHLPLRSGAPRSKARVQGVHRPPHVAHTVSYIRRQQPSPSRMGACARPRTRTSCISSRACTKESVDSSPSAPRRTVHPDGSWIKSEPQSVATLELPPRPCGRAPACRWTAAASSRRSTAAPFSGLARSRTSTARPSARTHRTPSQRRTSRLLLRHPPPDDPCLAAERNRLEITAINFVSVCDHAACHLDHISQMFCDSLVSAIPGRDHDFDAAFKSEEQVSKDAARNDLRAAPPHRPLCATGRHRMLVPAEEAAIVPAGLQDDLFCAVVAAGPLEPTVDLPVRGTIPADPPTQRVVLRS